MGPIYHISCVDCWKDYIRETERSFKARFAEHKRPSSVNSEVSCHIHQNNPSHTVSFTGSRQGVKESIFIQTMKPSLNRDGGRFHLYPIWHNIVDERNEKRERAQSC